MPNYNFSRLSSPDNIRLVRLLPSKGNLKHIRCEIFQCALRNSNKAIRPYEALSYVWGGENKPQSITVIGGEQGDGDIPITENLHAALLYLHDHDIHRTIWVDAISINQSDQREKEHQIPLMAEIYAKASRVIVWLGEEQNGSTQALEAIRTRAESFMSRSKGHTLPKQSVKAFLERPWFRRIWVLQEVAAARQVLIACGAKEIDGYAFCLGLENSNGVLERPINQVTFLIRDAITRPRQIVSKERRFSLNISSLAALIDMYHTHEAKEIHDKVYALLGMCSDNLAMTQLRPNYSLKQKELMQQLFEFLFSGLAQTSFLDGQQMTVIQVKGCVLGRISAVNDNTGSSGIQRSHIWFRNPKASEQINSGLVSWNFMATASSIREGDILCLLHGRPQPTLIRPHKNCFIIIMIAAVPLEPMETSNEYLSQLNFSRSAPITRDFLLTWSWGGFPTQVQNLNKDDAFIRIANWWLEDLDTWTKSQLDQLHDATRIWNVSLILADAREINKSEEKLREAIKCYETALGKTHADKLEVCYGQTPLSWAAGEGYATIVDPLLKKNVFGSNMEDYRYGRTALLWAANNGHAAMTQRLLTMNEPGIDSKDSDGQTSLSLAAGNGHEAVVELLITSGAVIDSKNKNGKTPLSLAARNGHLAIVQRLAAFDADIDLKDHNGRTPLSSAAENGHEAVVEFLLKTNKVDIESKGFDHRTPLSWAIGNGHEKVAKVLLATGQINANSKDIYHRTPLMWAAINGKEAETKLLLGTDKVDVNLKCNDGHTALSWAASHGKEAVVKALLAIRKLNVDSKNRWSRTPLFYAAREGHEPVVRLLLETGKVDISSTDVDGLTPLLCAIQNGHKEVAQLLLEIWLK